MPKLDLGEKYISFIKETIDKYHDKIQIIIDDNYN